jgi:hypothetical protein
MTSRQMLELAQRTYNVFHVVIEEGDYARHSPEKVRSTWTEMLGQHVIFLADHKKLAETIVSAIEVAEGAEAEASARAWGGGTARVVHEAVKNLPRGSSPKLLGSGAG